MELSLSRALADKRIFPAIDVKCFRNLVEEGIFAPNELSIMWRLRRVLVSRNSNKQLNWF